VGVSFERNLRHFDWNGRLAPTNLASEEEIFAVAAVADEAGRGVIQFGGDRSISTRLAKASQRPVFYGNITQQAVAPDKWRKQLGEAESLMRQGHRAYQFVMPRPGDLRYTLKTAQHFDAMATWKNVMLLPHDLRTQAFRDPQTRAKLHLEAVETPMDTNRAGDFTRRWDLQFVFKPALPKNQHLKGKSVAALAREQNKDVLDAFLDLALEENLETEFERREVNSDEAAMTALLTSPYTVIDSRTAARTWFFAPTTAIPPICCLTGSGRKKSCRWRTRSESSPSCRRRCSDSPTVGWCALAWLRT
jgi:N-acyl-D-aspartate/D-glutamate deacylase